MSNKNRKLKAKDVPIFDTIEETHGEKMDLQAVGYMPSVDPMESTLHLGSPYTSKHSNWELLNGGLAEGSGSSLMDSNISRKRIRFRDRQIVSLQTLHT